MKIPDGFDDAFWLVGNAVACSQFMGRAEYVISFNTQQDLVKALYFMLQQILVIQICFV
jgi:hypothetical protein